MSTRKSKFRLSVLILMLLLGLYLFLVIVMNVIGVRKEIINPVENATQKNWD